MERDGRRDEDGVVERFGIVAKEADVAGVAAGTAELGEDVGTGAVEAGTVVAGRRGRMALEVVGCVVVEQEVIVGRSPEVAG